MRLCTLVEVLTSAWFRRKKSCDQNSKDDIVVGFLQTFSLTAAPLWCCRCSHYQVSQLSLIAPTSLSGIQHFGAGAHIVLVSQQNKCLSFKTERIMFSLLTLIKLKTKTFWISGICRKIGRGVRMTAQVTWSGKVSVFEVELFLLYICKIWSRK